MSDRQPSATAPSWQEPSWVSDVVWWQLDPLTFLGAEPTAGGVPVTHRLRRLTGWLDYLLELGASGLALGPIFASQTHGYDTIDHFRIDPRLGDERDFAELIDACHQRGVRVLLDGVFNHVGRDYPRFARLLDRSATRDDREWFISHPSTAGSEPGYATFEGHRELVALNHAHPPVTDYVADVIDYWLRAGADGWRLDAAYTVPRQFWSTVLARVRSQHPNAYLIGEVIHGDYPQIATDVERR